MLKLEPRFGALPATVTAVTGTGGHHLYFRLPDFAGAPVMKNTASALAAGIDTRGEGGYVVAPPSIHPNGNPYGWGAPDEFAAAPVWLLALLDTPKVATLDTRRPAEHWSRIIQDGAGEGCRNQTTAALAGKLLRSRLYAYRHSGTATRMERAGVPAAISRKRSRSRRAVYRQARSGTAFLR